MANSRQTRSTWDLPQTCTRISCRFAASRPHHRTCETGPVGSPISTHNPSLSPSPQAIPFPVGQAGFGCGPPRYRKTWPRHRSPGHVGAGRPATNPPWQPTR
jgi:hypothetical protein